VRLSCCADPAGEIVAQDPDLTRRGKDVTANFSLPLEDIGRVRFNGLLRPLK
jgi:hypothetical protein